MANYPNPNTTTTNTTATTTDLARAIAFQSDYLKPQFGITARVDSNDYISAVVCVDRLEDVLPTVLGGAYSFTNVFNRDKS